MKSGELYGANDEFDLTNGKLRCDASGVGWCSLSMLTSEANYYVLDTDYSKFALIYGCSDMIGGMMGHFEWAYLLSRENTLDDSIQTQETDYLKYLAPNYDLNTEWGTID
jgi:hypothetical protein